MNEINNHLVEYYLSFRSQYLKAESISKTSFLDIINKYYENVIDIDYVINHTSSDFYKINDLALVYLLLNRNEYLVIKELIHCIRVLEYFGDYDSIKELINEINKFKILNCTDDSVFKLYQEMAKALKNSGEYEKASTFYLYLLENSENEINYTILLIAKFFNDYSQRDGLYKTMVSFANHESFKVKNETKKNIIILDTKLKLSDKSIIQEIQETGPKGRQIFTLLEKKICSKDFELEVREHELLIYIKTIKEILVNENYRGYYERMMKIIDIILNDVDLRKKINEYFPNLKNELRSAEAYSIKHKNRKLLLRIYKVQVKYENNLSESYFDLNDIKNLFIGVEKIKEENKNKEIKSQIYLEFLDEVVDYFMRMDELEYANKALNNYKQLVIRLIENLKIDQEMCEQTCVTNLDSNSVLFFKLTSELNKKEINILKSFRSDYDFLIDKYIKASQKSDQILEWSNKNFFNLHFKFLLHDIAKNINVIDDLTQKHEQKNPISEAISEINDRLREYYQLSIEKKVVSLNIHDVVQKVFLEVKSIYRSIDISFDNYIPKDFKLNINEHSVKMIVRNALMNIFNIAKKNNQRCLTEISVQKELNETSLIFTDNIGDYEHFLAHINGLNIMELKDIKYENKAGNGLKMIKSLMSRDNSKFRYTLINNRDNFKSLYIPILID